MSSSLFPLQFDIWQLDIKVQFTFCLIWLKQSLFKVDHGKTIHGRISITQTFLGKATNCHKSAGGATKPKLWLDSLPLSKNPANAASCKRFQRIPRNLIIAVPWQMPRQQIIHYVTHQGFCYEEKHFTLQRNVSHTGLLLQDLLLPLETSRVIGNLHLPYRSTTQVGRKNWNYNTHYFHFSGKALQAIIIPSQSDIILVAGFFARTDRV